MNDLETVSIRYDGLDAERHEIELAALGQSLQGMAKIISVSGHFCITQEYAKQMQVLQVRTVLRETRANCFTVDAVLQFVKNQGLFEGFVGALLTAIIGYVFHKRSGNAEEMKALKDSLDVAIRELGNRDQRVVDRLLSTIDKMADSLQPAVRQAITPIGPSCQSITVNGGRPVNEKDAAAIRATAPDSITEVRDWSVLVTELDIENGTARVRLLPVDDADDRRVRARITDPSLGILNNRYSESLHFGRPLIVTAKAALDDGDVKELYISDARPLV